MTEQAIHHVEQVATDPWNYVNLTILGSNLVFIHEWLNVVVAGLSAVALAINISKNLKKPKK